LTETSELLIYIVSYELGVLGGACARYEFMSASYLPEFMYRCALPLESFSKCIEDFSPTATKMGRVEIQGTDVRVDARMRGERFDLTCSSVPDMYSRISTLAGDRVQE